MARRPPAAPAAVRRPRPAPLPKASSEASAASLPGRSALPAPRRAAAAVAAAWVRRGRARRRGRASAPAEQVLGEQRDRASPGCARTREGQVAHPGVLAAANLVLDPCTTAVAQLQGGDVLAVLVGDAGGVPIALVVKIAELRTRMRALATQISREPVGQARAQGGRSAPRPGRSTVLARHRRSPVATPLRAPGGPPRGPGHRAHSRPRTGCRRRDSPR